MATSTRFPRYQLKPTALNLEVSAKAKVVTAFTTYFEGQLLARVLKKDELERDVLAFELNKVVRKMLSHQVATVLLHTILWSAVRAATT